MLQPQRGDGPLIKAAGTSARESRGQEQRLCCGESEPFKCGRRAEPEAGLLWGGASGWSFGPRPPRPAPPVGMPPQRPQLTPVQPNSWASRRVFGPQRRARRFLDPAISVLTLQEMHPGARQGKAEQYLAQDCSAPAGTSLQGTFLPQGPCGGWCGQGPGVSWAPPSPCTRLALLPHPPASGNRVPGQLQWERPNPKSEPFENAL